MKFRNTLLLLFLFIQASSAHSPILPKGNENISSATHIDDPSKSWAIYGELDDRAANYYSFEIDKGDRILLSLLTSTNFAEKDFTPKMALMGTGIKSMGNLSPVVAVPNNYGVQVIKTVHPDEAFYEPFGQGSYYQVAELDIAAPSSGKYYVAIFNENRSGHYSLAVGYREEVSMLEMVLLPLRLLFVYQWSGQSLAFVLMPIILAILIGIILIWRSVKRTPFMVAGTMAGMLFLGSSAMVLVQTLFQSTRVTLGQDAIISVGLAVISAIFGVITLRLAHGEAGLLQRVALAVIGTLALIAGSGFLVGPVLALAASVLASKSS
ncbi:MAG: hypothetical protein MUO26_04925 [Methanotrichaceae archaeon]|nr:hypothetical protein [Methanotrichaceae archaeon]